MILWILNNCYRNRNANYPTHTVCGWINGWEIGMKWKTIWIFLFLIFFYLNGFNCELSMSSYNILLVIHLSTINDFYILFSMSHSSSYLPWTIGYSFISSESSMDGYESSIHQLWVIFYIFFIIVFF